MCKRKELLVNIGKGGSSLQPYDMLIYVHSSFLQTHCDQYVRGVKSGIHNSHWMQSLIILGKFDMERLQLRPATD